MNEKLKLLIVDDNQMKLLTVVACLKGSNYQLNTFTDVFKAIEVLKSEKFDVIISGVNMSPVDGFNFRDIVREYYLNIPMLFISSLDEIIDSNSLEKIIDVQYSFYLNKEFDHTLLCKKIDDIILKCRSEQEIFSLKKRIDSEFDLAKNIQQSLLPEWCNIDDLFEYAFIYQPHYKVSGDLFEWISISKFKKIAIIGDIAGHGVHAALIMSVIQSMLRRIASDYEAEFIAPHIILQRIHNLFVHNFKMQSYMTCLVAIWDFKENTLEYQTAGHPDIICINSKTKQIIDINPKKLGAIPLAVIEDSKFTAENSVSYNFSDDDCFFILTDGLFDLNSSTKESCEDFDLNLFYDFLKTMCSQIDFIAIAYKLIDALRKVGYDKQIDDLFFFCLRKRVKNLDDFCVTLLPTEDELNKMFFLFEEYIEKLQLPTTTRVFTELVLSEFLTNIIRHATNKVNFSNEKIAVYIQNNKDNIKIIILDKTEEFNIHENNKISPELMLENLSAKYSQNGRGIPIIMSVTSSISHKNYVGLNENIFFIEAI